MQWLFLINQMRTSNSRERVKVWRLTKKVGALLYRNSVYVLPYSKERLEDFQWLCEQIRDSKGDASIFLSEARDKREDRALRQLFVTEAERGYAQLDVEIQKHLKRTREAGHSQPLSPAQIRSIEKDLVRLEEMFQDIHRVDFFNNQTSGKVEGRLREARAGIRAVHPRAERDHAVKHHARSEFHGKLWATRAHIHIDRLCSAWLIKRFIDPRARFTFAPEEKLPKAAIPFDVVGAEFSHRGDHCTFETLLASFTINDKALSSIAELVHQIDLNDEKFNRPESAGLDMIVRAISDSLRDDRKTLELGSQMLDVLYEKLSSKGKS